MTTRDEVRTFVLTELKFPGPSDELTDDYPLLERAVLDSNGLVQMVAFLEDRCAVVIDDEDLVPENFGTIASITALVEAKRAPA
jgi:acyl carrier protein